MQVEVNTAFPKAEWTDKSSNELKASEEPQMKVTLEPEDVSEDYFVSSYKKPM